MKLLTVINDIFFKNVLVFQNNFQIVPKVIDHSANYYRNCQEAHYDIFKSLEDMCGQGKIRYCYNNEGIRFENES